MAIVKLFIDICATGVCKHGATCIRGQGLEYECLCPPGLEGPNCDTDIDECLSQPCQHGGQCINLLNDYTCCCPPDFTGKSCESENICKARQDPCFGKKCSKYTEAKCDVTASFSLMKNGKTKDVTDQCNNGNN